MLRDAWDRFPHPLAIATIIVNAGRESLKACDCCVDTGQSRSAARVPSHQEQILIAEFIPENPQLANKV
ncbi:hypothetical protein OPQ81_009213 [Rhizoctonia solani]|nr:hypothetical protein OPQ81_009213 [Rhizoctonia solani]